MLKQIDVFQQIKHIDIISVLKLSQIKAFNLSFYDAYQGSLDKLPKILCIYYILWKIIMKRGGKIMRGCRAIHYFRDTGYVGCKGDASIDAHGAQRPGSRLSALGSGSQPRGSVAPCTAPHRTALPGVERECRSRIVSKRYTDSILLCVREYIRVWGTWVALRQGCVPSRPRTCTYCKPFLKISACVRACVRGAVRR